MSKIRLSKVMADRGLCSRREADRLIERGEVIVDGVVVDELGVRVDPTASVTLKSSSKQPLVTVALHKSIGVVSTPDDRGKYPLASSLLVPERCAHRPTPLPRRLNVAGRLDIDSTGLLILTEDGRVARALISPNTSIEKEYHVQIEGEPTREAIERLTFGLALDGKALKRAKVELIGKNHLKIVLQEGKKRQVRRMCEAVGLRVKRLMRVRIGDFRIGKLGYGQWKQLSDKEVQALTGVRVESV